MAAPILFFRLWPGKGPIVWNLAVLTNDVDKAATARLGALLCLFMYASLAFCTLLWLLFFSAELGKAGLLASSSFHGAMVGGYLGVSWAGVSIWLLALGAATGRMRREIPGLRAPLKIQLSVWLLGALAEETWRAAAILALVSERNSFLLSVIVVGIAFASGFLKLGFQRSAVALLEGVFLGFLFLWRGSLVAPFTAHLAIQAVYLWGVGESSQDRKSRKTWQIPGTKCPVCHTHLKLLQIKVGEAFACPSCNEQLSLSDNYQNVMRFSAAFGFFSVLIVTIGLLHLWLPDNLVYWLMYPVSYGIATSCLFLYRRTFTRLFPPQLQRGTPYFITLNLEGRREVKPRGPEGDGRT